MEGCLGCVGRRGDEAWVRAWKTEYPGDVVEVVDASGRAGPDLADRQVQKNILGRLRGGLVKAIWVAHPPTSEWGRGDERDRRARVVESATLAILQTASAQEVPVGVEARRSHPMWQRPGFVSLARAAGRRGVEVAFCAWGSPVRRIGRVFSPNVDLRSLHSVCGGRGVCEFSGAPHSAKNWIDRCPAPFARDVVACFKSGYAKRRAEQVGPIWNGMAR